MQRTAVGRLWLGSRRDRGAEACPAGRSLAFGDCFFCCCLFLSRMFVCFFSFYKCQPTSHSSWQPGAAVGADPVPEGQPLLGALLWTWKVVTLWDGALLTIHILLQAHRARSRASNCPMPPPHWTLQNPGGRAPLTVSACHWGKPTQCSFHQALQVSPCADGSWNTLHQLRDVPFVSRGRKRDMAGGGIWPGLPGQSPAGWTEPPPAVHAGCSVSQHTEMAVV